MLLLTAVLPALHQHEAEGAEESHCQDRGPAAATHLETLELAHHEPCGLCTKTLSSTHLEQPRTALVDELAAESLPADRRILPPGPPGRHGESRAPPIAGSAHS
ncbi:MAG: hypothetical protein MI919_18925 [Holophagales bacterium]|nr:hypothetical protein [Holophagales bacterium]